MKGETAPSRNLIIKGDHRIAEFAAVADGPTLIAVGGIHGNEPSGMLALRNVSRRLSAFSERIRGRVYFLIGNTQALMQSTRFVDADLNRHWTPANVSKANQSGSQITEDIEVSELLNVFENILATAKDEVFVLDLHSTSAEGLPFGTVGDTLRNRHFARRFPVTMLLGIEEQLEGTMLEYLNNEGAVTLGFEGGQHSSQQAIENHEALVWLALVNSGILAGEDLSDLAKHRRTLVASAHKAQILEVRYRKAISEGDEFEMNPGFKNFDPIRRGQLLASDRNGTITAVETGLVMMPLYQQQGEDGFFIGRKVALFWLWLSEILRRLHVASLMPILPGVSHHPADDESLIVDTRIARLFPLQIFHLLGFRRLRWEKHHLVVSRRRFDTESPFVKR